MRGMVTGEIKKQKQTTERMAFNDTVLTNKPRIALFLQNVKQFLTTKYYIHAQSIQQYLHFKGLSKCTFCIQHYYFKVRSKSLFWGGLRLPPHFCPQDH